MDFNDFDNYEGEEKKSILVVDDSVVNLASIEHELRNKYNVITINSGVRALRYLKNEKPDLILLDIQMALKDGIETLREIREMENGATIPVIMLTSKKDRETIIETTKLGICDYVIKPFDSQDLEKRIERGLKKSGVIPVGDDELYERIREAQKDVQQDNRKGAITRVESILNFMIDEEIMGRMQSIRTRLEENDMASAQRMLDRAAEMLRKKMEPETNVKSAIHMEEIEKHLLYILSVLKNFKVKEAAQKLEEVLSYELPEEIEEVCKKAKGYLEVFDDGAAEELIRKTLDSLSEIRE